MTAKIHRILLIDEQKESANLTTEILEKGGYQVIHVDTASAGKSVLKADSRFDLIITEILMPGERGFKFLKYVKSDRRLKRIPVVLCTVTQDARSVQMGIELGASDYILKPLKEDVFLAKVDRAIGSGPGELLVVDDEELLLNLLQRILEREGHRVVTAVSADEALKLLKTANVCMVISDIKMPGMNGLELLAKINEAYHGLPVLLMTGHASEYGKEQVMSAGADGYITKPFNNMEIIHRIGAVLLTSNGASTTRIREKAASTV